MNLRILRMKEVSILYGLLAFDLVVERMRKTWQNVTEDERSRVDRILGDVSCIIQKFVSSRENAT